MVAPRGARRRRGGHERTGGVAPVRHYAFMKIICSSGTSHVGNWTEIVLIVVNHVTDITEREGKCWERYLTRMVWSIDWGGGGG